MLQKNDMEDMDDLLKDRTYEKKYWCDGILGGGILIRLS